jgi:hypothetical protein
VTEGGGGVGAAAPAACPGLAGVVTGGGGSEAREPGNVSEGVAGRGRGCGVVGAADSEAARDSCVGGGAVAAGGGGLMAAAGGCADTFAGGSLAGATVRLFEANCPRQKSATAITNARTAMRIEIRCSQLVVCSGAVVAVAGTDGALALVGMTDV